MTYNSIRPCKEISTNEKGIFTHSIQKKATVELALQYELDKC